MSTARFPRPLVVMIFASLMLLSGCGYGSKTQQGSIEVYYIDGATKAEADKLGAFLVQLWNASTGETRSVQLKKTGSSYQFRMVVKKGFDQNPALIAEMGITAARISGEVLNGADVETHLCDEYFKTLRTVPMREDMRSRVAADKIEVFYAPPVKKEEAEAFLNALKKEWGGHNEGRALKLARREKTVEIHMVIKQGFENNQQFLEDAKQMARQMSGQAFAGDPTEMHLCDEFMNVVRVVKP